MSSPDGPPEGESISNTSDNARKPKDPKPTETDEIIVSAGRIAARVGVSVDSVIRWIRFGVSVDGRVVRLAATRPGRHFRLTWADYLRFQEAKGEKLADVIPDSAQSAERARRGQAALDELRRMRVCR